MRYREVADLLQQGQTVRFRPHGNSMQPKISSGQLVTVVPATSTDVTKGDIVLCKVRGTYILHLLTAVNGKRYQISNNHGRVNGWIGPESIFGKCIKVEP